MRPPTAAEIHRTTLTQKKMTSSLFFFFSSASSSSSSSFFSRLSLDIYYISLLSYTCYSLQVIRSLYVPASIDFEIRANKKNVEKPLVDVSNWMPTKIAENVGSVALRTLHGVIILRLLFTLLFFVWHIRMSFIFPIQTHTHVYTDTPSVLFLVFYSQNVFSHQLAATSTTHCRMSVIWCPMPRYYSIFVLHSFHSITRKRHPTHTMKWASNQYIYISLQVGLLKCFRIHIWFPIWSVHLTRW